jgi:hypothetical protein
MKTSHKQCGTRSAGSRGGRWIGPTACARIRRDRRRVERRVLDRVAHREDGGLAVRLDLEQCAAALEPEEAARRALELVADVHVLMCEADVELEVSHDGPDVVAFETHRALHALGVDRARAHPLLDRDGLSRLRTEPHVHGRQRGTIQEMPEQHVLSTERREYSPRECDSGSHMGAP